MVSWRSAAELPPWAFDYDHGHYAPLNRLLHENSRFVEELRNAIRRDQTPPPYILAFAAAHGVSDGPTSLANADVREVAQYFHATGVSRTSIFAFVLVFLLADPMDETRLSRLRMVLYPRDESVKEASMYPLGIHDPEKCVFEGIKALAELLDRNPDARRATEFKLVSKTILKGRIDGIWRTLVAYCGNCGHWPLVWNVDSVLDCRTERGCRHARLVCRKCGHCGAYGQSGCREQPERRSRRR